MRPLAFIVALLFSTIALADPVVLYTSVDRPYVEPLVAAFTKKTGIEVKLVTDTEASKSVGIAERLRAEKAAPKADVWWGNEVFYTIPLADDGLLTPYDSPAAKGVPDAFRDPQRRWTGVGLRVRVIVAQPDAPASVDSLDDLLDPAHKNAVVLARPTAGTTGGHVAALYTLWGDDKADDFFRKLRANGVTLVGGNSIVAQQVGAKRFALGLTDNDDVAAVNERDTVAKLVLPDQGPDGLGTLAIPTTVGLVAGSKRADDAKKLIDFLVSPEIEKALIDDKFAAFSVRAPSTEVRVMAVKYEDVAKKMPEAIRRATAILDGR
jgi:iron(III) transport system substrate-binding protein